MGVGGGLSFLTIIRCLIEVERRTYNKYVLCCKVAVTLSLRTDDE